MVTHLSKIKTQIPRESWLLSPTISGKTKEFKGSAQSDKRSATASNLGKVHN